MSKLHECVNASCITILHTYQSLNIQAWVTNHGLLRQKEQIIITAKLVCRSVGSHGVMELPYCTYPFDVTDNYFLFELCDGLAWKFQVGRNIIIVFWPRSHAANHNGVWIEISTPEFLFLFVMKVFIDVHLFAVRDVFDVVE